MEDEITVVVGYPVIPLRRFVVVLFAEVLDIDGISRPSERFRHADLLIAVVNIGMTASAGGVGDITGRRSGRCVSIENGQPVLPGKGALRHKHYGGRQQYRLDLDPGHARYDIAVSIAKSRVDIARRRAQPDAGTVLFYLRVAEITLAIRPGLPIPLAPVVRAETERFCRS